MLAVSTLLKLSGAADINFTVVAASPWRVVIEDIGFALGPQSFTARRVTITREHWWTPSLGTLRVEQARVPVSIDVPLGRSTAGAAPPQAEATREPWQAPLEEFSMDAQLLLKSATLPSQELAVKLVARQSPAGTWNAQVSADGPGLALQGHVHYHTISNELSFKAPSVALDLQPWQDFMQRLLSLPGGAWEAAGRFTGSAEGRLVGGKLVTTSGTIGLREGRAHNPAIAVAAEGIEADLEITDVGSLVTKPGTLRVRELKAGQLALSDLDAEFALKGADTVAIHRTAFKTLGGTVTAGAFIFHPAQPAVDTVVMVEGIDVEQVMALTRELPARATGRVNGRFPLRIDDGGLRFGTGWLELKPGVHAEIQFNATGLLTGGVSPRSPTYAVLQKVESGLLKLKVNELRLDIRPPNAPPGRTAQLHLAGEPVDPGVKAPVVLDLNVNGPLEKLINLGLDSRVSFGSKE
jgi:hypothetical protein